MASLFAKISKWIKSRPISRNPKFAGYRPTIDLLEDRLAPALYIWNPQAGTPVPNLVWSRGDNWVDGAGTRYALNDAPQQVTMRDDTLRFTGASAVNSTDDVAGANVAFARLEIAQQYTGTITLNNNLTVKDGYINGGTISANANELKIDSQADFAWNAGTLSNGWVATTQTTTVIVDPVSIGATTATLQDCWFTNEGIMRLNTGTLYEKGQSFLLNGPNATVYMLWSFTGGITSDFDAAKNPTSVISNFGTFTVTPTVGEEIDTFSIYPYFTNSGQITVPNVNRMILAGGGNLMGTINLGGAFSELDFAYSPLADLPPGKDYSYRLQCSVTGTGTLGVLGAILNNRDVNADVTLGSDITLPATVRIQTRGGKISGPGKLTLQSGDNMIQNTWIRSGATLEVPSDAAVTFLQSSTFPRSASYSSSIQSGARLLVSMSGRVNIGGADLYIGDTSTMILDRGFAQGSPTVTFFGPVGTQANILTTGGGQIVSSNGLFTNTIGSSAITGVVVDGNTVTVTTAAAHNFAANQSVTISIPGQANRRHNATFRITQVTATTFTYSNPTPNLPNANTGTATFAPQVQVPLNHTGGDHITGPNGINFSGGVVRSSASTMGLEFNGGGGANGHQALLQIAQDATFLGSDFLEQALLNDGNVKPGGVGVSGLITPAGGYAQTPTGTLFSELDFVSDQIATGGEVSLAGGLQLAALNGFAPSPGTEIRLIDNQSTSPVDGEFQGLPEGAPVSVNAVQYVISYVGGDGNDVVLTAQASSGGSIGNFIWNDLNQDGIQDSNETAGVAGVTVYLFDGLGNLLGTRVTDSFGSYNFAGLGAGDYRIHVVQPTGYLFSPKDQGSDDSVDSDVDSTGFSSVFTLGFNEIKTDIDAGLYTEIIITPTP